ncbi:hypothetical protein ISR94_00090 [Candidatus Microgenomates bacterium]|nr:hypothetical protein [Candidatus Microgenomates bacterium]
MDTTKEAMTGGKPPPTPGKKPEPKLVPHLTSEQVGVTPDIAEKKKKEEELHKKEVFVVRG